MGPDLVYDTTLIDLLLLKINLRRLNKHKSFDTQFIPDATSDGANDNSRNDDDNNEQSIKNVVADMWKT